MTNEFRNRLLADKKVKKITEKKVKVSGAKYLKTVIRMKDGYQIVQMTSICK